MNKNTLQLFGLLTLISALFGIAIALQHVRDASFPPPAIENDAALYLTSGQTVRRLSVAYQALAADVYWIRAIQHYGGTKRAIAGEKEAGGATEPNVAAPRHRYDLLYPLLDLTTTLDPRFNIAYRFGAIFLAEPYPGGAGRPDLAIALLEKGLRERPDKWEYMQDIGFVHYWWRHDYPAAAAWFRRAGEAPGGPWWLRSLAATTLAQGGDRQSSRLIWESLRESDNDWLRREADRRLAQLKALDDVDRLQLEVNTFTERTGQRPTSWRVVPLDPTGTPYELDTAGRVRLSAKSPLYPLPTEQPARPPS